jgi:hypothetical protein
MLRHQPIVMLTTAQPIIHKPAHIPTVSAKEYLASGGRLDSTRTLDEAATLLLHTGSCTSHVQS